MERERERESRGIVATHRGHLRPARRERVCLSAPDDRASFSKRGLRNARFELLPPRLATARFSDA